ncbi:Leucine-rich repeat [Dillenia turbinata]|uniref:Leucine-rich repeat n=1 Tax=Dillenia turbinata TaxID=194707 RepID=A0AAN8ZBU5_9MAGN
MAADCEFSSFSSQSEESSPMKVQSEESSSKEVRNWLELPSEVTCLILKKLGTIEILINAQRVCKLWWKLCKDPAMWRTIDLSDLKYCRDMDLDPEKVARNAVDRSCGELVDISIEDFGTDILMEYITARTSNLKRLRLVCCCIYDEGLSNAAKKLPLLEDLEISLCSFTRESLEVVGRCCPRLRTLKYNKWGDGRPRGECDEEALAIAECMPELRHLQLFGNKLTNDGLQAILDGCPHLEYLDLRWCFNITLPGDLGRRCAERLKTLRRPNDPTHDYEFHAENLDRLANECFHNVPSDIDRSFFDDYEFDYDDFFSELYE